GNELVAPDTPGAIRVFGSVLDGAGEPVTDALVELWLPDGTIGRSETVDGGRYSFVAPKPSGAYLVLCIFARGLLKQAVTRTYFPDEDDPVLAGVDPERRGTLIAVVEPEGLRFDIRLQGKDETVFFAL